MIVTPVYCTEDNGRFPLLLQSIYWIAQQTYRNIEHIIVNDGSTDETPELLDMIAQHNPHIRVYHKENRGSSSAVNFGVSKALSENDFQYVTVSHSDDVLPPRSIEERINLLIKKKSKWVYSDMLVFNDTTKKVSRMKASELPDAEALYHALMRNSEIPYATMLWDRAFFTDQLCGYDNRITSSEDWDIALRSAQEISRNGEKHSVSHDITAAYRIHENRLRYQNLLDGTKWRCYKMILRKHLNGKDYQMAIARQSVRILRALLPESIKKSLRSLRNTILSNPSPFLPYQSEFIESLDSIKYREILIPSTSM